MSLFSVQYDSDGNAKAIVDFEAVRGGNLGSIIAKINDADADKASYKTISLAKLLDNNTFNLIATKLVEDGVELTETIEFGRAGSIRIARVAATGEGWKEAKRKLTRI